ARARAPPSPPAGRRPTRGTSAPRPDWRREAAQVPRRAISCRVSRVAKGHNRSRPARFRHVQDDHVSVTGRQICAIVEKKPDGGTQMARLLITVLCAIAVQMGAAAAQDYPSRPITIIVPFPAGGPTDTLARILGDRMKDSLGQSLIVENVTGAGATIGVGRAVQAAADGYTLILGNWTSHVRAPALYPV